MTIMSNAIRDLASVIETTSMNIVKGSLLDEGVYSGSPRVDL